MPSVVRVEELGGDRAEILLRAVADAKTEHMARLVARQRDSDTRYVRSARQSSLQGSARVRVLIQTSPHTVTLKEYRVSI